MKRFLIYILVFLKAFLLGVFLVLALVRTETIVVTSENMELATNINQPSVVVDGETPPSVDEYKEALGNIWIEDDETRINGYEIKRKCSLGIGGIYACKLTVKKNGKVVAKFENERGEKYWLRYGFFNFLKKNDKQLVVHTYSGGAHCCYDYYIYDLSPRFHPIYKSTKFDSANEIGDELVPVDIDGDGVYEFYQDVMAFDYDGAGGHASASFPPAIFRFDRGSGRFDLATKRFPKFVLAQLSKNLTYLDKEIAENKDTYVSADDRAEYDEEYRVRETFLFWMYAGKREKAWEYFRNNYRSKISGKYMDEFREQFIGEFHETFRKDPTYLSIYDR